MILIALGSNLPFLENNSQEIVRKAAEAVFSFGEGGLLSSLYSSPAWPDPSKPSYVNAVLRLDSCEMEPEELLVALLTVEMSFGRQRAESDDPEIRYAPRTLDLDLLAFHDFTRNLSNPIDLRLPHPRMQDRDFVLLPMRDVVKSWQHPQLGLTCDEMVEKLAEKSDQPFTAKLI